VWSISGFTDRWLRRAAAAAAIAAAAVAPMRAIERTKLPAFELIAASGQAVSSRTLIRDGRWLLVYVQPDCAACDTLLRLVSRAEHPQLAPRMVVVEYGAAADTVRAIAAQYPELEESRWLVDLSGTSKAPLQLTGTPAIYGMNGDTIEWSLAGVLTSPDVKSILVNWLSR
jgi:hypothetical protein